MSRKIKAYTPAKFSEEELAEKDKTAVVETKELEKKISQVNNSVSELILAGAPNLTQLSWELYEKYRRGELQTYFDDDKELEAFYKMKKKEVIANLITFLSIASAAVVDPDKIRNSSIKDVALAMKAAVDLINGMMGEPDKHYVHTHEHVIKKTPEQIREELHENKQKLEAIEAEFKQIKEEEEDSF